MSIAGMICIGGIRREERWGRGGFGPRYARLRFPVPDDEIGEKLQPGAVALFRMELRCEDISPGNRASKRRRIVGGSGRRRGVSRVGMIAVREIETRLIGNARPQRMR